MFLSLVYINIPKGRRVIFPFSYPILEQACQQVYPSSIATVKALDKFSSPKLTHENTYCK